MVFSSSIFMYMGYSKTASLDINVNISDLFIRLLFKKNTSEVVKQKNYIWRVSNEVINKRKILQLRVQSNLHRRSKMKYSSNMNREQPRKSPSKNPFKFFKGCLPQILLDPFLNTLSQISLRVPKFRSYLFIYLFLLCLKLTCIYFYNKSQLSSTIEATCMYLPLQQPAIWTYTKRS